jgi:hypothetical protein
MWLIAVIIAKSVPSTIFNLRRGGEGEGCIFMEISVGRGRAVPA